VALAPTQAPAGTAFLTRNRGHQPLPPIGAMRRWNPNEPALHRSNREPARPDPRHLARGCGVRIRAPDNPGRHVPLIEAVHAESWPTLTRRTVPPQRRRIHARVKARGPLRGYRARRHPLPCTCECGFFTCIVANVIRPSTSCDHKQEIPPPKGFFFASILRKLDGPAYKNFNSATLSSFDLR